MLLLFDNTVQKDIKRNENKHIDKRLVACSDFVLYACASSFLPEDGMIEAVSAEIITI